MLAWAAKRVTEVQDGECDRRLRTWASEVDRPRQGLLVAEGFQRDNLSVVHLSRELGRDLPDRALPDGWDVRPVGDRAEFPRRVELHRAVWAPSRMKLDAYGRLRAAPGFHPDLDLVLVAPDGSFAAYCICWLDPTSRSATFEPVGTRPDLQGKGLGRLLVGGALRRLRDLGATVALVSTAGFNQRAINLYEAVGFRLANREHRFSKNLGPSR
jgi:ribosomal protein S18 acetylase RimI-like enzyme